MWNTYKTKLDDALYNYQKAAVLEEIRKEEEEQKEKEEAAREKEIEEKAKVENEIEGL